MGNNDDNNDHDDYDYDNDDDNDNDWTTLKNNVIKTNGE